MDDDPNATATDGNWLRDALAAGVQFADLPETATPKALVPAGWKVQNLEPFQVRPVSKRATPEFRHAESAAAYIADHMDGHSRLYADVDRAVAVCVLDEDEAVADPERPRWRRHRATFAPPKHPDWIAWRNGDGKLLTQSAFAVFLEDQEPNLIDPNGADLLELCQDLQLLASVGVRNTQRLDSGARVFQFAEEHQGRPRGGKDGLELPERFTLALPVFRHGEKITIEARLRYRLDDGKLLLGYGLIRALEAEQEAFEGQLRTITEATGVPLLWGEP